MSVYLYYGCGRRVDCRNTKIEDFGRRWRLMGYDNGPVVGRGDTFGITLVFAAIFVSVCFASSQRC